MDKESAKQEIRLLIEKYDKILKEERYIKSKREELTKQALIEPLFHRVLGWNIEDSNEVTKEERISKGWVDYSFRINGIPKFFLEAKSIREDLDNPKFFQQAVSYALYKGCAWAVLTNFENVKILNAEWKAPNYLQSHFMTIECNEFLDKFDDLWLLSKESFEQGLLDKLAERYGKKTKRISIDKQLLSDFTRFRDLLSKSLTKLNRDRKLTEVELDESVQRILDRLIFIRNCEDRGLEEKKLWETRGETRIWKKIRDVFSYYDKNYDSKLFTYDPKDLKKVHLCDTLDIDEGVIREIIECLYRTKDDSISYDFSIIPADTLGTVYEQYLGHILKKTEKTAKLTENHAHRKEQGIYYTPVYIVDYIVRNTLGELLKDNKVKAENIRILDPACGSGSFLIKAFDVLDEHYLMNDKNYSQTELDLKTGGTFTRKVKILQDNIFGVDLDEKAVEIAQLNLLLKIAEKGHRLPLLERNIRRGNSLIDDESFAREQTFKWEEQFKEIMTEGGFDVVVGNPPYIRNTELADKDKEYFGRVYSSAYKQYDIYVLFFEVGLKLLKNKGYLGFITSNKFIASEYGSKLRDLILKSCNIKYLIDVSNLRVFKDASTYPVIIILQKDSNETNLKNNSIAFQRIENIGDIGSDINIIKLKQSKFSENNDNRFLESTSGKNKELMNKMENDSIKIKDLFNCKRGSPKNKIKITNENSKDTLRCVVSRDVDRYSIKVSENIFVISSLQTKVLPEEKILMPRTVLKLKASYDKGNIFVMDRIYYLTRKENKNINIKFILGILNSKLMDFFYKMNFGTTHVGGGYLDLRGTQIEQLPIRNISIAKQETIIQMVDKMISFNKRINELGDKRTDNRARIEEEIKRTDMEIDELVYQLYGITETEKKVIENS